MKTTMFAVGSLLLSLFASDALNAQPALRELEDRLNRLLAPPSERPTTPEAMRGAETETGYAGFFADNAAAGVRGALITSVNRGGPAEAAGIRIGDLITAANGTLVHDIDDLSAVLGRSRPGDSVELNLRRDGVTRRTTLTLTRRPTGDAPGTALPAPVRPDASATAARGTLGVRVVPISDDARIRYGISVRRGALIQGLTSGGPAQRAGLQVGSVIVAIDGRRVDSPDDLVGYIRTTAAGQRVEMDYYQGSRLERVEVQLGPSGTTIVERPTTPPLETSPPSRRPIFGEDRPALRKIESVIDRLVDPATAGVPPGVPPAAPPVAPSSEVEELRTRVDGLQHQVETLQRQLDELQRRLAERED